ncbi:MAG: sugar ABC transporter ATP-binding protein [Spirochaetia bacterium]|jgi:ABC-type sugar transport system ATPase subunit|nr:sugar ABC transporter ATP-binding protein [Spirochaetia bacterium]
MSEYVLEMLNIDKSFFKVKVIDNVTFKVKPGEVHAIVGENGAGKSTLMKILMGIYRADSGEILLEGKKGEYSNPREALDNGIAMIHQELNPILDMEIAENIFTGRELTKIKFGGLSIVDHKAQRLQTEELLKNIGISLDPKSLMRKLSVAQTQLIEIVKAISLSSKIVIMDEPTSAITDKEVENLFRQIKFLKAKSVAVIYISHKMDEIFKVADTITVLRDGKHICTEDASKLDNDKIIKMMVGREIKEIYPERKSNPGEVVLEVSNFTRKKKFKDISFKLHKGEILGIGGLVGAGRSELVEGIFGVTRPDSGDVFIKGEKTEISHPKKAIKKRIALITEDRKFTGLDLKATVAHNITLVHLSELSKLGVIDLAEEARAADEQIEKLDIRVLSRKSMINSLSGGNQQKVVLAKWLLTEPEIIILDDPTRGIDVGAKRDIYLLMASLAKAGKAIILISSEISELMGLSDRIIVLAAGRLTGELSKNEFTQENIMRYASTFEVANV